MVNEIEEFMHQVRLNSIKADMIFGRIALALNLLWITILIHEINHGHLLPAVLDIVVAVTYFTVGIMLIRRARKHKVENVLRKLDR